MTLSADFAARAGGFALEVSLEVERGPLVLAGPNGAGKTSTLLALLGVLRVERGRIVLDGRTLCDSASAIEVPIEQRGIGYVPQDYALFPHLTVRENVLFGVEHRFPREEARERAQAALEELRITGLSHRRPGALSGGERQRVALARALAPGPSALLLDEPLAALDAQARRSVRSFLAERLRALRIPALVVTHDAAEARDLADRIAILEEGRIVQRGTLADLASAPATPFIAQFVSDI